MSEFIVTRKSDGQEVYRYSHNEAVEWQGMEFATHTHTAQPEEVAPPPPKPIQVWDQVDWQRRFTQNERIAIRFAATQSVELNDYLMLMNASPRVANTDPDVISAVMMLEQVGLIAVGRADEVLYG